ncbi:MAG TPA: prephenate dehydratase domain-containing protein, partial [Treponemataceae bacterium]|nr:prephenate dehydratase domain-containing protein [Treponemataceae bacterium]
AAGAGVLPIENSLTGSIHRNYDLLLKYNVWIVGETYVCVMHSLIVHPGTKLEEIRRVYSHPQGLAQCSEFLAKYPHWKHIETESTSAAAELVASSGDPSKAAIASDVAGPLYRLDALKSGIETDPRNYTRFVVIARSGEVVCDAPNHASVIFSTANEPGSLHSALGLFMKHGLNLTKLESRPIQGEPWRYRFYANVSLPEGVGSSVVSAERIRSALAEMEKISQDNGIVQGVRVLGLYSAKEI